MQIDLLDFSILAFASFTVTYLIMYTDGLGDIFKYIRRLFGIKQVPILDDDGNVVDYIYESNESLLAKLMECFWCFNTWVSLAVVILYIALPEIFPVFVWLAMIGVAGTINKLIPED